MDLVRFRPILVTFLLILLYGSGSLFVTGLSVISISIIATFFCFIFKMQLDFDVVFLFIKKLGFFEEARKEHLQQERALSGYDEKDYSRNSLADGKDASLHNLPVATATLKDLPRPIARKLKLFIDGVMNEFVESWYVQICPEDRQFANETKRALERIAVEGYKRICDVDTHSAAVNLINLVTTHLKIFSDCRDAVNSKYPGINAEDFERCITELYETRIKTHISSKSQGTALDFLRKITDIILYVLVPQNAFSCEGGRFMLREILAIQGLQRLVELLSDPHFVNKALIDIFEEGVPLDIILQQWKEESQKELDSADEEGISNELEKADSDVYESATEGKRKEETKKISKRIKNTSDSSIEHIPDLSDNVESKFATPRHSTTEWSSAEESYDAFDRVLRQNQLEARESAPVYGSTMVKLHEKSERYKMPNVGVAIPNAQPTVKPRSKKADSGIFSLTTKARSYSNPVSPESLMRKNEKTLKTSKLIRKEFVSEQPVAIDKGKRKENDVDLEEKVKEDKSAPGKLIPVKEKDTAKSMAESWSHCPSPSSDFYRKVSYNDMDRRQDLPQEQFKAKLHAIGSSMMNPVSCLQMPKRQLRRYKSLPDFSTSLEVSMRIAGPEDHDLYSEVSKPPFSDTKPFEVLVEGDEEGEFLKVHGVPDRNVFYEAAPDCPTCIEMTSLASPLENGQAVMTVDPKEKHMKLVEHECGLIAPHYFHPETKIEDVLENEDDRESFVSCDSDSLADLDDTMTSITSESTLLASNESIGNGDSSSESVIRKMSKMKLDFKSSSVDSFEVVSMKGSGSEYSSANDLSGSAHSIFNEKRDDLEDIEIEDDHERRVNRAPSVTTFGSAIDSSTHEGGSQTFKTSSNDNNAVKPGRTLPGIAKHFKRSSVVKKQKGTRPELPARIIKSLREIRLRRTATKRDISDDSSDDERGATSHSKSLSPHSRKEGRRGKFLEKLQFSSKKAPLCDPLSQKERLSYQQDSQSSFSGATDSDPDYRKQAFQTPSSTLPLDSIIHEWHRESMNVDHNLIEEVADEVNEESETAEYFEDARSMFGRKSIASFVESVAESTESVNHDDESLLGDDIAVVNDVGIEMSTKSKADGVIPIYQGEVILPHPSKMAVSAWMYPMQMISIPSTEVAFEKRWEPGGNKYTLYSIHYDIRIWPEIYQRQLMEASHKPNSDGDSLDSIPIIREIKRRYREFMFLHNRLTHSQMSEHMKGVLRPNRRYAMPFGRMDPDVIEGRRKILETYLVSLVSRQDVCNSREFKEFLGAEGYGTMVSFIKPKVVQPKQMGNKMMGSIKSAFPGSKEERGESLQYFIHGYDVPRMFGYAEQDSRARHSFPWFSSFVDIHETREMLPEGQTSNERHHKKSVIGQVEFCQRPQFIGAESEGMGTRNPFDPTLDALGPRSSGDGADDPEPSRNGLFSESPDRRFSIGIPALFTNELAARSRSETLSSLDALKNAEEIPWPLSDAVMSFLCQGLKGYDCWLTYENVQQALLYSLGGILEWQISRAIDEIVIEERWMKYLNDLYFVIWEDGKLKEPEPDPTDVERKRIKEEAVEKMLEFLPAIVRIIIGSSEYKKWAEGLLHALQYQRINRHLLYAAIDLVMGEFIPELQTDFPEYREAASSQRK